MYFFLAILAALLLSAFQYLYKRKALWLFILRFFTYSLLLILLINPKIETKKEIITKPPLYVLADNSLSIKNQNAVKSVDELISKLKTEELNKKFNLHFFKFDNSLNKLDSLNFTANQTDIGQSLSELVFLHQTEQKAPVILITDGQSNTGSDYAYNNKLPTSIQVFPVVTGDTTRYANLKIDLLNVNPYAYQGDFFPVEIFVSAQIKKPVQTVIKIINKNKNLDQQKLRFTPENNTQRLNLKLKAGKPGVYHYKVVLSSLNNEKNKTDNISYFSVEVIDNAKKVLIISDIIHPDIGAVKRSLNSHKFIQANLKKASDKIDFNTYESFVLYQPNSKFEKVFNKIKQLKKSWWLITGKHTDWRFINRKNLFFNKLTAQSFENYFAIPNETFGLFKLPELKTKNLPPLVDQYGRIDLKPNTATAYYSKINGLVTKEPLLAFNTQEKQAVLFGENIWQWAMQAGVSGQKKEFNQLVYQIIQYLSLQKDFERLDLDYKKQYYQGDRILIVAKFLNRNLEPDAAAQPVLIIKNKQIPMQENGDFYQAELSALSPGNYRFSVQNKDKTLTKSGYFSVLPFSLEAQNLSADLTKLKALAKQTGGQVYFPDQAIALIDFLKKTPQYHSLISYKTSQAPLVDYKWLLFFIALLLAIEWLVKKLRGEL